MGVIFPVERSEQWSLIICALVFSILPSIAVGLRIIARRFANRKLDLSDWLIIAACINVVGYQGLNIAAILTAGGGYHITEITGRFGIPSGPEKFIKFMLVLEVVWATSLALTKTSILVLYCKIFTVRTLIWIAQATAVLIVMWMMAVILGDFLICQPTAFYWDQTIPGGHCGESVKLWLTTGTLNIFTDLIVLFLPMPYIISLEMALYKRLVLIATFGAGFLLVTPRFLMANNIILSVVIISALRLESLVKVDMSDVTYTVVLPILWSALEPCVAIVLACIPLLRPVLGRRQSKADSVEPGGVSKSIITIGKKSSRKFDKLRDEMSVTQLTTDIDFRLDILQPNDNIHSKYGRWNSSRSGEVSGDTDIELGTITVKKEWKVISGASIS